jgi:hypothetical protein
MDPATTEPATLIAIDLAAPMYRLAPVDLQQLPEGPLPARAEISRHLIRQLMTAAHPQGMDGKDGRLWSAFLDRFLEETITIHVSRTHFEWLLRQILRDELRIPHGLAHWRAALEEYLMFLQSELRRGTPPATAGG